MGARETFVTIRGSADGIGKLKDIRNGEVEIEYFDSPCGPRLILKKASVRTVEEVELKPQMRVFAAEPSTGGWTAGRIDRMLSAESARLSEDCYVVHFPNGRTEQVPISRLFVRWNQPIEDPTEFLGAQITDTPFFSEGRSRIVRHLAMQRSVFGGLTALASSRVELLEHQVSIVRQVLADPIQRYLLADEVGLGKTIEAGVLIKQHLLDFPNDASILIVVPDHLQNQWKRELSAKFEITSLDARVKLIALSKWSAHADEPERTLLVIDEAHLLAGWAFSENPVHLKAFANAQRQAERCARLLLISGTPVLHQESQFLAMLNLLDPHGYPLDDLDSFRLRVLERSTIAEAMIDLADGSGGSFVEDALSRLQPLFPSDERLRELSDLLQPLLWQDEQDRKRVATLRALRTHIRETYKLHRRLLRTRRIDPRIADQLMSRSGVEQIVYDDAARVESAAFLDLWRQSLTDERRLSGSNALFAMMVSAALEHPTALVRLLEDRLALLDSVAGPKQSTRYNLLLAEAEFFEDEKVLLEDRKELIASLSSEDERFSALSRWFEKRLEVRRLIIFVSSAHTADYLARRLRDAKPSVTVSRFTNKNSEITEFHSAQSRSILVCDRSAEEGLNLQRSGATILHFDLPLDALRIEQRIGRLDRIEAIGRLRNVVFAGNLPYESEWLDCLLNGVSVFSKSVSALQYLLATSRDRVAQDLVTEGRMAFIIERDRLLSKSDGIEAELRRIESQEQMDSIEVDSDAEHSFFEKITQVDEEIENQGQSNLDAWVVKRLLFNRVEMSPEIGRYVYVTDQTLVPLVDAYNTFQDSVDYESKVYRRRHELPLAPSTFSRSVAVQKGVTLLRIGNPMLTALEEFVRRDDRGSAFGFWRFVPESVETPAYFFRFDFVIEADLKHDDRPYPDGYATALRRKADEFFSVQYKTIWLTSDLEEVFDADLISRLRTPYSRHSRSDGGFDQNLNAARWALAQSQVELRDWQERCERARREAECRVRLSPEFSDVCSRALRDFDLANSGKTQVFDSRLKRLSGSVRESELIAFEKEEEFDAVLRKAIETPSLRLDSVGLVILAAKPLIDAEELRSGNGAF